MFFINRPKRGAVPDWQTLAYDRIKQTLEVFFGEPVPLKNFVTFTLDKKVLERGVEYLLIEVNVQMHGVPVKATFQLTRRNDAQKNWDFRPDNEFIRFGTSGLLRLHAHFTHDQYPVPFVRTWLNPDDAAALMLDPHWRAGHHLGDRIDGRTDPWKRMSPEKQIECLRSALSQLRSCAAEAHATRVAMAERYLEERKAHEELMKIFR